MRSDNLKRHMTSNDTQHNKESLAEGCSVQELDDSPATYTANLEFELQNFLYVSCGQPLLSSILWHFAVVFVLSLNQCCSTMCSRGTGLISWYLLSSSASKQFVRIRLRESQFLDCMLCNLTTVLFWAVLLFGIIDFFARWARKVILLYFKSK